MAVKRLLVVLLFPADRQVVLFLAFEIGRAHRSLDEGPIQGFVGHARAPVAWHIVGEADVAHARPGRHAQKSQTRDARMFREAGQGAARGMGALAAVLVPDAQAARKIA